MGEQEWICEKCTTNGIVAVWKGDGIYDVVNRIRTQHQELSPGCEEPVGKIKLFNPGGGSE